MHVTTVVRHSSKCLTTVRTSHDSCETFARVSHDVRSNFNQFYLLAIKSRIALIYVTVYSHLYRIFVASADRGN